MKTRLAIVVLIGLITWSQRAATPASPGEAPAGDELFDPVVSAKAQGASSSATNAGARTLFPTPVLLVTPAVLEFGPVVTNKTATNTFLVENMGRGRVVGKALVNPPFKVIEGGTYSLTRNEKQVVTVIYAPRRVTRSNDVATVTFSGAGVAKATAVGTAIPARQVP